MVAILTENGQPDTTFAPGGFELYDVGGTADHFWGAAVSPDQRYVAIVGIAGAETAASTTTTRCCSSFPNRLSTHSAAGRRGRSVVRSRAVRLSSFLEVVHEPAASQVRTARVRCACSHARVAGVVLAAARCGCHKEPADENRASRRRGRQAVPSATGGRPAPPSPATAARTRTADGWRDGGRRQRRDAAAAQRQRRQRQPARRAARRRQRAATAGEGGTAGPRSPTPPFTKRGLLEAAAAVRAGPYEPSSRARARSSKRPRPTPTTPERTRIGSARRVARGEWRAGSAPSCSASARPPRAAIPAAQNLRDEIYFFPLQQPLPGRSADRRVRRYAHGDLRAIAATRAGWARSSTCCSTPGPTTPARRHQHQHTRHLGGARAHELAQRRADYAAAAAADVSRADRRWSRRGTRTQGDFYATARSSRREQHGLRDRPGRAQRARATRSSTSRRRSRTQARLPLGLVPDCANCTGDTCPSAVESRYARVSTDHLRQNLTASAACSRAAAPSYSGLGFDDWLGRVGAGDLATACSTRSPAPSARSTTLDPPLEEALVSDSRKVRRCTRRSRPHRPAQDRVRDRAQPRAAPTASRATMTERQALRHAPLRAQPWLAACTAPCSPRRRRLAGRVPRAVRARDVRQHAALHRLRLDRRSSSSRRASTSSTGASRGSSRCRRRRMHALFWVLAALALCDRARASASASRRSLFALGFAYLQLIDVTTYLNHYYLATLLALLLALSPGAPRVARSTRWLRPARARERRSRAPGCTCSASRSASSTRSPASPRRRATGCSTRSRCASGSASRTGLPLLGPLFALRLGARSLMSWAAFCSTPPSSGCCSCRRPRPFAYAVVIVLPRAHARAVSDRHVPGDHGARRRWCSSRRAGRARWLALLRRAPAARGAAPRARAARVARRAPLPRRHALRARRSALAYCAAPARAAAALPRLRRQRAAGTSRACASRGA